MATIASSKVQFSSEPQALLPLLEEMDRGRDPSLQPLIEQLAELNILPIEAAIFDLRAKFRSGDHAKILRAVDRVLAISNDNVEALRTGGRVGNLRRDDTLALRFWEQLGRVAPNDPEAALQVARIHRRRGQHAQALTAAIQAVECRPDPVEPLQIGIDAGLHIGWPEGCDALLARLFTVDKSRALKVLAQVFQNLDCTTAARAFGAVQAQVAADQTVRDLAAKAHARWLVAALEQELASRELEAAVYYRAARSVRPADTNPQRALDRLSLASLVAMREAFNSRDFSGAVEHGLMATRINPDIFEAWQTVGRAQFARGNVVEASVAFCRCTELNARDAVSWLTYGLTLNQQGEHRRALAAFQKARDLSDSEVKREADASIAAMHPLLTDDAKRALAAGDIDLAWEFTDAALTIRPNDADIRQIRSDALRRQREQIREAWSTGSASAVSLCRRYLEKSPGDTYAATVLGRTLMRLRAYAEALPVWEGLSKRNAGDSHNHLQVARCCRSLKIKDRGIAAAAAALRLDPSLGEAAEIADFLRSLPPPTAAR